MWLHYLLYLREKLFDKFYYWLGLALLVELLKVIAHLGRNRFSDERFTLLQWRLTTHPGVHEDEIHLREREDELEDRVDSSDCLVARGVPGNLEPRPELQSDVDHCTQPEC